MNEVWESVGEKSGRDVAQNHTGIYLLILVELLNFLTQETSLFILFYKEVNFLSKVIRVECMYCLTQFYLMVEVCKKYTA